MTTESGAAAAAFWERVQSADRYALEEMLSGRPTHFINELVQALLNPQLPHNAASLVGRILEKLPKNYLCTTMGIRLMSAVGLANVFTKDAESQEHLKEAARAAIDSNNASTALALIEICPKEFDIELYKEAIRYQCVEAIRLFVARGVNVNTTAEGGETALHACSRSGNAELAAVLLEKGIDVNAQPEGGTALLIATQEKQAKVVKVLLAAGAKPNLGNVWGNTPLHYAVGSTPILMMLLAAGANPDIAGYEGKTPLHWAVESKDLKSAKILVEHGADANLFDASRSESPLHTALRDRAFDIAHILIRSGADVLGFNRRSMHPLDLIEDNFHKGLLKEVYRDFPHAVKILEECADDSEFSVKVQAAANRIIAEAIGAKANPIEFALLKRDTGVWEVVKKNLDPGLFMSYVSEVFEKYSRQRIFLARCLCDVEAVNAVLWMIDQGEDIFKADRLGSPLLHYLCSKQNVEMARLIIRRGAAINITDSKGMTPLHIASMKGSAMVELLCSFGANIEARTPNQKTPIHLASKEGKSAAIKALLQFGANPNARDEDQNTPLHLIVKENRSLDCMESLVDSPVRLAAKENTGADCMQTLPALSYADINAQGQNLSTPLHLACKLDGREELAEFLIQHGADLLRKDKNGHTPLDIAMQTKKDRILAKVFEGFDYIVTLLKGARSFIDLSTFTGKLKEDCKRVMSPSARKANTIALEVPLLLNCPQLAAGMIAEMDEAEFQKEIALLEQKYPQENVVFIKLCRFSLVEGHMKKGRDTQIPEPMDVDLSRLVALFDGINFTDPGQPGYRNPDSLKDDGEPANREFLRGRLATLVSRIEKRQPHTGTPPAGKPELLVFYNHLEKLMKHIVNFLISSEDLDEKASCLIDLSVAANHCGMRWMGEAHQLYQTHVCAEEPPFLTDIINGKLLQLRVAVLNSMVDITDAHDVHQYGFYVSKIGKELGIPGAEAFLGYEDFYSRLNLTQEQIWEMFYKKYNPQTVCVYLKNELDRMYRRQETKDMVIDWFIENMPRGWGNEEFGAHMQMVKQMQMRDESKEQIIRALRKRQIHCPVDANPLLYLEKIRGVEYLHREIFESAEDGGPTGSLRQEAVVHMLQKVGVLRSILPSGSSDKAIKPSKRRKIIKQEG